MKKVVKWISWGDADKSIDNDGVFNIADISNEEAKFYPYFKALKDEMIRINLRLCGDFHQCDEEKGVPVFDDGSVLLVSMRKWGMILAQIWSEINECEYGYMEFYKTNSQTSRWDENNGIN